MTNASTLLPAIRAHVGDWTFYSAVMTLGEVASLIQKPDEVHESSKLSEWIQRQLVGSHVKDIAEYLHNNEQRFLGSIIVGVYGGRPDWASLELDYSVTNREITAREIAKISGRLGLLRFNGSEKLFAIDGQHRVEGIKRSLQQDETNELADETVCTIFVGHDSESKEGLQRTRRLFTTLNKKAKPISKSAKIALDEDDGFAVITRMLIDNFWLFGDDRNYVAYNNLGNLPPSDQASLTSVVGLYEIVKDLYPRSIRQSQKSITKTNFENHRPPNSEIEEHYEFCERYFRTLCEIIPEYAEGLLDRTYSPGHFRSLGNNHLLFRPIGQRAFARAAELLIARGYGFDYSLLRLANAELNIESVQWEGILWDRAKEIMLSGTLTLAETNLLDLCGEEPRTNKALEKLQLIRSRQ